MIASPLNYTGGKYRLLTQILPLFPADINCFVDLFCGGCNVGINTKAEKYIFNDLSEPLISMFNVMLNMDSHEFYQNVDKIIVEYGLSDTKTKGYSYYGCESNTGLAAYNKESFIRLRTDCNNRKRKDGKYYIMLYVLIVFSFNNQIRFNSKGEFNLPPGKRDFNVLMKEKLVAFIEFIHTHKISFTSIDFRVFDFHTLAQNDFVYADPPYLITCASYNEQKGWTKQDELDLLAFLDKLTRNSIRFALSNVLESKGIRNVILSTWVDSHPEYHVHQLNFSYSNASYQRSKKNEITKEVLITNY